MSSTVILGNNHYIDNLHLSVAITVPLPAYSLLAVVIYVTYWWSNYNAMLQLNIQNRQWQLYLFVFQSSNMIEQHALSKGFDTDFDTIESNQQTSRTELNGQQLC